MPTRRRTSRSVAFDTGSPATEIRPAPAVSTPLRCSTSVVLPAPFGPSTATRSPGSTRRSIPYSAWCPSG